MGDENMSADLKFRISHMMCQKNCAKTVREAILEVAGVSKAIVSYAEGTGLVWGVTASPNEIIDAVDAVGYDAELLSSRSPAFIFHVDHMMCQQNCARTVREAVMNCAGVESAEVSYPDAEAKVWGVTASAADIIAAIEDVGYEANLTASLLTATATQPVKQKPTSSPTSSFNGSTHNNANNNSSNSNINNISSSTSRSLPISRKYGSTWDVLHMNLDRLLSVSGNISAVETTLRSISAAVKAINVDHSSGKLSVQYDSSTLPYDALVEALAELDYYTAVVTTDTIAAATAAVAGMAATSNGAVVSTSSASSGVSAVVLNARKELLFEVTGMSCANCANRIEKKLSTMIGIIKDGTAVSSMTNRARVLLDETAAGAVGPYDITEAMLSLGFGCKLLSGVSSSNSSSSGTAENSCQQEVADWYNLLVVALLFGVPVFLLHMSMHLSSSLHLFMMGHEVCSGAVPLSQSLMLVMNTPILIIVGFRFYKSAVISAFHGSFGMDFLVMTGTSVTFFYSCVQFFFACSSGVANPHMFFETTGMLLMFVTVGKFIEAYAKGRSASAIKNLLKLQPNEAHLVVRSEINFGVFASSISSTAAVATTNSMSRSTTTAAASGANAATTTPVSSSIPSKATTGATSAVSERIASTSGEVCKTIALDLVQRGHILKVFPGDRIPTDGVVAFGQSFVDEAMITGESTPVQKLQGDLLFGSTVNQTGVLYVKVTSLGSESALAQIVALVEAAQMNKAPVQAYADRIAGVFTPAILLLATLTFVVWCFLSLNGFIPKSWFEEEYNDPYLFSMLFAISVVVISCPCALGLATPTAIMVGTSVGAANGILIKGGGAFETAHSIRTVIFDKTGTLTKGHPNVTDIVVLNDLRKGGVGLNVHLLRSNAVDELLAKDALLRIAATAEQSSDHPIARAIKDAAHERNLPLPCIDQNTTATTAAIATTSALYAGSGVSCSCAEGSILVGNRLFMEEHQMVLSSLVDAAMWDLEVQGKTAVCVALNETVCGLLAVADTCKPEAFSTIQALRAMEMDVWMVTGDNRTTALAMARLLDIPDERVVAGALPRDKVAKVQQLQLAGVSVAMIGDGINDSPALAQADLGVAIGAGTEVAMEAADMVLIRNNLHDLVVALDLAKKTFDRIRWNFLWAIVYNVLAIPAAAGVWFPWTHQLLPPQYAGLAMALSSVSVVLSSMALWGYKRPLLDDQRGMKRQLGASVLDSARRGMSAIRDRITEKVNSSRFYSSNSSNSGGLYQQLPNSELDDDISDSLGIELGIGSTGSRITTATTATTTTTGSTGNNITSSIGSSSSGNSSGSSLIRRSAAVQRAAEFDNLDDLL